MSTDQEEQLLSYENQVNYYTNYISENPLYEYAGTYADEGISGTNTKKRDEFNRMIADCRAGKIDMIITKSISRFARNTLDCLNYVRELKDLGIGIIFEKENINTLDAKGEVLLTILSSLAQDESRSISENCTWGIRRRFETGKHKMSTKRFLGYDTDETGKLVINRTQEPIVIRLYQEFLDGKTTDYIKRIFEREGVKNWDGGTKWQSTTLMSMLENEKYKGDALLQKSYTVDFLTKKRTQNKGEIQMFYVEDDHDAIISKRIWECVQLEIKRRKKYLEEHGANSYSHRPESNPFASKIICGDCNKVFARKGWRSSTGVDRKVWQCSERYKVKGVMGCVNTRIERVVHGQDSWTREIELEIPVSNVEIWDSQIRTVERMLKFLTGDLWKITLSSRAWQFNNLEEVREKSNKYDEVSLFSGGMDSLISTINLMENKKNTLLISHAGEGLTKNAQKNIVNKFDLLYPDVLHTWLDLWMVFPRDYIPAGGNDNNTRSRSFLFIGYALFAMTGMDNINELLVPENGLIALNVPLDETRVGSFSTRTTHPFYLSLWNELLVGLGLNLSVKNPYWNKTKGEMAGECKNKDVLYETMKLSFSCSSPGKARWKQLSQQHCGYCVPCLIRRAAMHKAFGDDGTVYTETSIYEMQNKNAEGMGIQLRSFQYAIDKIKQDRNRALFYIHKPGPLPQDDEYLRELADTYIRGLLEVDAFIQDNLAQEDENNDL